MTDDTGWLEMAYDFSMKKNMKFWLKTNIIFVHPSTTYSFIIFLAAKQIIDLEKNYAYLKKIDDIDLLISHIQFSIKHSIRKHWKCAAGKKNVHNYSNGPKWVTKKFILTKLNETFGGHKTSITFVFAIKPQLLLYLP